MDEQGGAGGVPPHDGHDTGHTGHTGRRTTRPAGERTAAADTDEASRLDRPEPAPDPAEGDERRVGPQDEEEPKPEP
ncbi:hypothetical protein ACWFQ8_31720 [Streptomyces sp. NPDC055254]